MRVGVDIGGTFTDFVGMGKDGQVFLSKESTTPKELTEAILRCFARVGLHKLADVNQILHGSTVAINTIIQQVGAKTALIKYGIDSIHVYAHLEDLTRPYQIQKYSPIRDVETPRQFH